LVYVGIVEYAHPTQGKILVKVQNGYELDEIHDVSIVTPVTGQTLVYNSVTDLWVNNTVSLTAGVNGTLPVANGGTGASTLTGYVKGSGTTPLTASATIPSGDITGLGTMSTQNANAVAITGGTINGTTIGATTPAAGVFTDASVTTATGQSTFNQNNTITGWIYSGNSFSVAGQETSPTGLFIGSNGTKMYVNGSAGDDVNEYTLSTAWDITTATFVNVFSTAAQDAAPQDIFFKPDGLAMFIMGGTNDTVFQYTLTVAWDVSTASYASKSFSVTTQEALPNGIWFKPDGLVMYVVGSTADTVFQYTLGTAWDVSTASYASISYNINTQEGTANQVNLSADGLKMWVIGTTGDDIWEYTLGTAWNVSTATPVNNFYIGFQESNPTGLFIDSTAPNRVYLVGSNSDTVFQYYTAANSLKLDTEKLYVDGGLSVNGNFVAGQNAYVDNALTVLGTITSGNTGSFVGLSSSGTSTVATSTATQTSTFGAGATLSGSIKTLNIGTGGVSGSTTNINIGSSASGSLGSIAIQSPTVNIGQTATQFAVTNTASAVNYVNVTGSATLTGGPTISAQGSDFNIPLRLQSKGISAVEIGNPAGWSGFAVTTTNNPNRVSLNAPGTGFIPTFTTNGVDTNAGMAFISKGTGAIDLAAGSSGVNISNGGTVTAITRTAAGSAYTSFPSLAITAPTTAGGVQATATPAVMIANSATIASGGTGYAVNDVVTLSGGTPVVAATFTVTAVSGGVVTAVTSTNFGTYSVLPSNPVGTTGGTGSGLTLNVTWAVGTTFTITNAGSGYVEQPTVTFSGGGGSGAAAYATVGSGTTVKTLGSTLSFSTPSSEVLRILDNNPSSQNYLQLESSGSGSIFRTAGASANPTFGFVNKGTGNFYFSTSNSVGNLQFNVAHTASAVNYVQVTGAATGNGSVISVQGSDTNASLNIQSKGTGSINLIDGSTSTILRGLRAVASGDTFLDIQRNVGFVDLIANSGVTNGDIRFTPKGTGNVRFGTYTGTILTPTGYVEIKDSGGTVRRLLVG
jgi:hypothetical protein